MATASQPDKRLAMAILDYFEAAVSENVVNNDGREGLEVARQCIRYVRCDWKLFMH